jgi:hypothetical protein
MGISLLKPAADVCSNFLTGILLNEVSSTPHRQRIRTVSENAPQLRFS